MGTDEPYSSGGGLPERGEFVIRGAHVLTMDQGLGDLPQGDVHVRGGEIVAVGHELEAGGGVELNGHDRIVLPGLIDTHWHLWTTLHRSMAATTPANAYFALNQRLGAHATPQDLHHGVLLGLTEAVTAGITTVHDWAHNLRTPAHADANLQAHLEVGLRGRFSYGTPQGLPPTQPLDLADLRRVQDEWFSTGRAGLLHLGLAGRPPGFAPPGVYRTEFEHAREAGLPVSYHVNSTRAQGQLAMIQALGEEGMLGPATQLIHALYTTPAERDLIASTGASVSVSPWSELLIGYGVAPIHELLAAQALVTLSVDTAPLVGAGDLQSVMRLVLGLGRGLTGQEFGLSARRVLEMATIDAARGLGLQDVTGSLTPGKRADLIAVRTDQVNIAPPADPASMIVLAAQPANVDTVVVDGRILKRDGHLTAVDPDTVVRTAAAAHTALLDRAGAGAN